MKIALIQGLVDADVAHLARADLEVLPLLLGSAEELDHHGARDVEALAHHHVHLGVELHSRAGKRAQPAPHSARGQNEDRQQHEGHQGDLPAQDEHGAQDDEGDQDDVADHVGEQVGEGLLGADDVVVQSTDQRAGLGAREERDRHLLDVFEDLGAQVVDETLADERRDARSMSERPASKMASAAVSTESQMIRSSCLSMMPLSMIARNNKGDTELTIASNTTAIRKTTSNGL
jgi:hypothetical protein